MGGSSGDGAYHPFPSEITDCNKISIITVISSPKPEALRKLKEGDLLSIKLIEDIIYVFHKNLQVGSIIHKNITKIIDCIRKGHSYGAVILSIEGGRCEIFIKKIS